MTIANRVALRYAAQEEDKLKAAIKRCIDKVTHDLGHMYDPAVISDTRIEGSYRSERIPKDDDSDPSIYYPGPSETRVELDLCEKELNRLLAPYKKSIKSIDCSSGEKSWIYITVTI